MSTKRTLLIIVFLSGALALALTWLVITTHAPIFAWQRHANPGDLSSAHADLENDCAACHTAVTGAEDAKCSACHANNIALLQGAPTAFHASVGGCANCHFEHQGRGANLRRMDHEGLALRGLQQLRAISSSERSEWTRLVSWVERRRSEPLRAGTDPRVSALEAILNCYGCHATKEPHSGSFGRDCATCHDTSGWTVANFQHPSPNSFDCAQCHRAPPSHYMEHFEMVSKKVASRAAVRSSEPGDAQVEQCYLCHQTTSWNDIKGVGWYKHH